MANQSINSNKMSHNDKTIQNTSEFVFDEQVVAISVCANEQSTMRTIFSLSISVKIEKLFMLLTS